MSRMFYFIVHSVLIVLLIAIVAATVNGLFGDPNDWETWGWALLIIVIISLPGRWDPAIRLKMWLNARKQPQWGRGPTNNKAEIIETIPEEQIREINERAKGEDYGD